MDLPIEFEKRGKNMLFGKTTITFAYKLGLRQMLYENSCTENFTHDGIFVKFRFSKFSQEERVFDDISLDIGSD